MAFSPSGTLACDAFTWLPAEASARRYLRLHAPRHVARPSAVVMLFDASTSPGEVCRVARATELLAQAGLPVPETFACDEQARWILQEDLGDEHLASPGARGCRAEAYSEAVSLLRRLEPLHLETSPRPGLDASRMHRELDTFATLGLSLPGGPGPGLAAEFDLLVAACLVGPVVLCHRDYHARNLMLKDGRVRIIDHQDALPGPAAYDRVSLAYDPYVDLPDGVRDRIAGDGPGTTPVAIQRLAKAIGTYAGKGGAWRRWIPRAARQARRLLAREPGRYPLLDLGLTTLSTIEHSAS